MRDNIFILMRKLKFVYCIIKKQKKIAFVRMIQKELIIYTVKNYSKLLRKIIFFLLIQSCINKK